MRRHGMENKLKTRAKSRKNKNRKGFVGDKSSSETDDVLGGVWRNTIFWVGEESTWIIESSLCMRAQLAGIAMLSLFGLWDQQRFGGQASLEASPVAAQKWGKLCSAGFSQAPPWECFPVWQHFDLLWVQMVPDQSSDLCLDLDLSLPQYKIDKFQLWPQIRPRLWSVVNTYEYATNIWILHSVIPF